MRELREDTFSGNKNDDAHELVERVLDIVSLFNIPGVTHDAVMLRVFPITLTGAAKSGILDKECPLKEEVKSKEEVKYGEFGRPFPNNSRNNGRFKRSIRIRPAIIRRMVKEILSKYETNHEAHDKIIQGLETKVRTLTNEVEGQINGGKFEECKAIFTEDGLPLYTPFYYSPEEIECFSANSGFSNNERQETNKSGMEEALATLDITPEIKQVSQEEKKSVSYYVEPYEPPIPFPRRLEHHAEEALVHETMESLKKIKINHPLLK
ncbi:hypothetical protein Tco_0168863 [Tanacetum coccineum]